MKNIKKIIFALLFALVVPMVINASVTIGEASFNKKTNVFSVKGTSSNSEVMVSLFDGDTLLSFKTTTVSGGNYSVTFNIGFKEDKTITVKVGDIKGKEHDIKNVEVEKTQTVVVPSVSLASNNNSVTLSWADQAATKFEIHRSTDGKKFSKLKEVNTITYTDKSLTYGKTYYYKVRAWDGSKWTSFSEVVKKKIIPNKISGFKATTVKKNSIKLVWTKASVNGYVIERSTDNKKWSTVKTITKNSTVTFTNTSLKTNKLYYYRIRAYKTVSGKKNYSENVTIKMKTAPVNPTVKVTLRDYNALNVKVSASKGATKYIIERSLKKSSGFAKVGEITEAGTYKDLSLSTGKTYYYRVKACNSYNKCSTYSKVVSLKVIPKTPTLSLKSVETKKVSVTVNKVNGATKYVVYRSTSKNGKYTTIKTLTSIDELTFDDVTKKGKTYYYKVKAYVNKVSSKLSGYKKITSK